MTRWQDSLIPGAPFSWIFFASDAGDTDDIRKMFECRIFFHLHFAGDTGDTGDMKNLKIYTKTVEIKV